MSDNGQAAQDVDAPITQGEATALHGKVGEWIGDELAEIDKARRTDRRAYNKDEATQARERELLDLRETRPKEAPTVTGLEDVDAEDQAKYRSMLANGVFSPDDLKRVYGLTDAEVEGLQKPEAKAPTRQSIDDQLAAIALRRKTDRQAYNKDEKMQARERQLLEARANLDKPSETNCVGPSTRTAETLEPSDGSALDPALLAEWEQHGGRDHHLGVAQAAAKTAIEALEGDEGQALMEGFDGLPASAQTGIIRFLAVPAGHGRAADDAAVQAFAADEAGGQLVEEWRSRAARNVGTVEARRRIILDGMSPEDRTATEAWFAGLPARQKRAVLLSLLR